MHELKKIGAPSCSYLTELLCYFRHVVHETEWTYKNACDNKNGLICDLELKIYTGQEICTSREKFWISKKKKNGLIFGHQSYEYVIFSNYIESSYFESP